MGTRSEPLARIAARLHDAGRRAAARHGHRHHRVRPLERLALDLLAVGRSHRSPAPRQVDSAAVVDEVLASLGSVLRQCGALVCVNHLPVVRAHEVQLATLFRDVILNAVAFASPGGRPRLTIGADRGAGEWVFSVVDSGNEREAQRVSSFVFTVRDG